MIKTMLISICIVVWFEDKGAIVNLTEPAGFKIRVRTGKLFFLIYVVDRLNKTVLLSTQNTCLIRWVRK